ncbi:unnamed protein product [Ixodes pacificus]
MPSLQKIKQQTIIGVSDPRSMHLLAGPVAHECRSTSSRKVQEERRRIRFLTRLG